MSFILLVYFYVEVNKRHGVGLVLSLLVPMIKRLKKEGETLFNKFSLGVLAQYILGILARKNSRTNKRIWLVVSILHDQS